MKSFYRKYKGRLFPSEENIDKACVFVYEKWCERAEERGDKRPENLNNACKFASMFALYVFGGKLQGNWEHQWVLNPDVGIIDLTDRMGVFDESHDPEFWGNPEHEESLESIHPRVQSWVKEFLHEYI